MPPSDLDQSHQASHEMSNLGDVALRTVANTPKAFYDELCNDLSNHTAQVVARVGEGAAIGIAATLVLKIPRVAPIAAGLGLAYTGYQALTAGSKFIGQASRADSEEDRTLVVQRSAHQLGGALANFTESAPGMIAGGWGASRAFGAPPLYTRIGDAVERNVVAPARESIAFRGPGSVKLSPSLFNQEGEFDALSAAKMLSQRHPWQGVETGSSLDLGKLRMSRTVTGSESKIGTLPGTTRDNVIPFHIHSPAAGAGFLPSNVDMAATRGLGILQQGDKTTFYAGQAREYAALEKNGWKDYFKPNLTAVVVDRKTGLMELYTGGWPVGSGAPELARPVTLDVTRAVQALSRMRDITSPDQALAAIAAKTGG